MESIELNTIRGAGPLYDQLRSQIQDAIEQGVWKPGELLPPETELSEQYKVSLGTVRQSILALVQDGFLVRRAGKGTFVKRLDTGKSFARFFRFRDTDAISDIRPEIRLLEMQVSKCHSATIAEKLGISATARVLYLRRAMCQKRNTICIYNSYLPYQYVKDLEHKKLETETLYDILEKDLGIYIVRAEEFLQPAVADDHDANLLGIEKKAPVILIERTAYTYQDKVVEFRKIVGRGDKFRYQIDLR